MRIIAPMMILIMMTSTLAGCTGGDPDGGGNDEIDMDILNQLIDDNLQDFINNTTIDVTNNYHDSDNSTIINYINGTSTMVSTLHTMTGNHEGYSSQYNHEGGILVLLVREDSFPQDDAGGIFLSLDGGNFCLNVGSEIEVELQTSFSYHGIEFTSIGTENILESKDKLISGECDAIAGDISAMMSVKNSLDNETSIQEGKWITNSIVPYSSTDDFSNYLQLFIPQERGLSTQLIDIYATVNLNKISDNGSSVVIETFSINQMQSNSPWFTYPSAAGLTTCENSLEKSFYSEGQMFAPGLECEHLITINVGINNLDSNYEYSWSDWAYYLHWSFSPVEMH